MTNQKPILKLNAIAFSEKLVQVPSARRVQSADFRLEGRMRTEHHVWLSNDEESASTWLKRTASLPYTQPIRPREFEFRHEALVDSLRNNALGLPRSHLATLRWRTGRTFGMLPSRHLSVQ